MLPSHLEARIGSRMTQHETNAGGEGELERVQSLVPGLDTVLCGGFLRGGLYMIQGPPGTGKPTRSSTAKPAKEAAPSSSPCWGRATAA